MWLRTQTLRCHQFISSQLWETEQERETQEEVINYQEVLARQRRTCMPASLQLTRTHTYVHTHSQTCTHSHTHTHGRTQPSLLCLLLMLGTQGSHSAICSQFSHSVPLFASCLPLWQAGISRAMPSYQSVNTSWISHTIGELAVGGRAERQRKMRKSAAVMWWIFH